MSVTRVWMIFYCFRRRHYDKAPLLWLSNVLYWQKHKPEIFKIFRENVTLFDEYGVENVHSILRAQTKSYFTVEQLCNKAKTIFASKLQQHNFRSAFTSPKCYSFSIKQLNSLKLKAARMLKTFFVDKAKSLTNGKYEINTNIWGSE